MIDDRLSLSVSRPDGYVKRWGPDEPDGRDIPNDLSFSDSIPGGHATLSTSLLRRIDVSHPDEGLFDDVHCYGPGGRTAWRGRMQQFPRTHGDAFGVSPGAVGWSAHLRDDPSFREIYIDRGFDRWTGASLARRAVLAGVGTPAGKITATAGADGLVWDSPNESLPAFETAELWYDSGGLDIGGLYYMGARTGTTASFEAPNLYSSTSLTTTTDSDAVTLNGSYQRLTLTPARPYLMFRVATNAIVTPAAGTQQTISAIGLYGASGIATRVITGEPDGVYASDVIADVISRAAPLLTYTTGAGGSIDPTAFVIPHLVYRDPATPEFVISDVNKYHLYDWGVYDDREFFYRQPDPDRLLWEARLSDGAHLDADGDTAEQVINGVFVTYTDPTGQTKTVGPPGGSFDDTDTLLADTSSSNPVNAHGIPRKWVQLNLSFPTTLAGATQIGYVYLQERSLAGRRGRVTLTGTATHPTEGKVPCWRVRAGDWISLKDLNGATVPRKIISKSYSHGSRQVVLDLDNTPAAVDAILARVGIQAGIATGGGF